MLDWLAHRLGVSTAVAALLVALLIIQIATQVYALVDLARRDVVPGGRKWLWALAIAFGNLPGAIAYLVAGRTPPPPVSDIPSDGSGQGGDAGRRAVDTLYGRRDDR